MTNNIRDNNIFDRTRTGEIWGIPGELTEREE